MLFVAHTALRNPFFGLVEGVVVHHTRIEVIGDGPRRDGVVACCRVLLHDWHCVLGRRATVVVRLVRPADVVTALQE